MVLSRADQNVIDDVGERIAVLFSLYDSSETSEDQILDYLIAMVQHFHHIAAAAISTNHLSEAFAVLKKCENSFNETSTQRKILPSRCEANASDRDAVEALKHRTYVLLSRLEARRNREDASLQPHPVYYKKHLPPAAGSRVADAVAIASGGRRYRGASGRIGSPTRKNQDSEPASIPTLAENGCDDDGTQPVMLCPLPPLTASAAASHLASKTPTQLALDEGNEVGAPRPARDDGLITETSPNWRMRSEEHLARAARVIRAARSTVDQMLTDVEKQQARRQRHDSRSQLRDQVEEEMQASGVNLLDAAVTKIVDRTHDESHTRTSLRPGAALFVAASTATAVIAHPPQTPLTGPSKRPGNRPPRNPNATPSTPMVSSVASHHQINYPVLFEEPDHPLFRIFAEEKKQMQLGDGAEGVGASEGTKDLTRAVAPTLDPIITFSDHKRRVMQRLQTLASIPDELVLSNPLHEEMKKKVEGGVLYKPSVALNREEMEKFIPPTTVDRIMGPRKDEATWPALGSSDVVVCDEEGERSVVPSLQHLQCKKDWTALSVDYLNTCLDLCIAARKIQRLARQYMARKVVKRRADSVRIFVERNQRRLDAVFIFARALRLRVAKRKVREQQKRIQHLIEERVELELKGGGGGVATGGRSASRVGTLLTSRNSMLNESLSDGVNLGSSMFLGGQLTPLSLRSPRTRRSSSIEDRFKNQIYGLPSYIPRRRHVILRSIQKKIAARKIWRFYVEQNEEAISKLYIEALGYADHLSGATQFPYCPSGDPSNRQSSASDRASQRSSVLLDATATQREGLLFTFQSAESLLSKYSLNSIDKLVDRIAKVDGEFAPLVPVKMSEIQAEMTRKAREEDELRNLEEERMRKALAAELLIVEKRLMATMVLQRAGRGYRRRLGLHAAFIDARQTKADRLMMWITQSGSRSLSVSISGASHEHDDRKSTVALAEHSCLTPGASAEIFRLIKQRSSHLLPEFREQTIRQRVVSTTLVQSCLRSIFSAEYAQWRTLQSAARTIQALWRRHMSQRQRSDAAKCVVRATLLTAGAWGSESTQNAIRNSFSQISSPSSSVHSSSRSDALEGDSW